jgi:hypothetical protein
MKKTMTEPSAVAFSYLSHEEIITRILSFTRHPISPAEGSKIVHSGQPAFSQSENAEQSRIEIRI